MKLKQLFCKHDELIMTGSIIFVFSPSERKYISEDNQQMKCKKMWKNIK